MGQALSAQQIIEMLDLAPLPGEGGYFRETFRDSDSKSGRAHSTAIYYLVTPHEFSKFHRLPVSEIFHFYAGDPVEMIQIDPEGILTQITLSNTLIPPFIPQAVVPAKTWQATRLKEGGKWALLGTTVAPGFEFSDLELGEKDLLFKAYPQHRALLEPYFL